MEKWARTDPSSKLDRCYQNLKTELMRIEVPENVANILHDLKVQNITITTPTKSSQQSSPLGGAKGKKTTVGSGSSNNSSSGTLKTESSHSSLTSNQLVTYGDSSVASEGSSIATTGENKMASASMGSDGGGASASFSVSPPPQQHKPHLLSVFGQGGPVVEDISSDDCIESDVDDNTSSDDMCM